MTQNNDLVVFFYRNISFFFKIKLRFVKVVLFFVLLFSLLSFSTLSSFFSSASFSPIRPPISSSSQNARPYPRLLPPSSSPSRFSLNDTSSTLTVSQEDNTISITGGNGEGVHTIPIYGSIREYAYYFVDIFVGSPEPQRVSVILDTGSSLLAFSCATCHDCGEHIDAPFNMSRSSTAEWVSCDGVCACSDGGICKYSVGYEEGSSIMGFLFKDLVQLGDEDVYDDDNEDFADENQIVRNEHNYVNNNNNNNNNSRNNTKVEEEENEVLIFNEGGNIRGSGGRERDTEKKNNNNDIQSRKLNINNNKNSKISAERKTARRLSTPVTEAYMGCHVYETNLFLTQQASGVMGICFRNENEDEPTVIQQLFNNVYTNNKIFSICFSHGGGIMTVGGYMHNKYIQRYKNKMNNNDSDALRSDSARNNNTTTTNNNNNANNNNNSTSSNGKDGFTFPIIWTAFPHRSYYSIIIRSMSIEGKKIADFSSSSSFFMGAMVDSGTTYTHIASSAWPSFIKNLEEYCEGEGKCKTERVDEPFALCWLLEDAEEDLKTFPIFHIDTFDGEEIQWKPQSYMYQSDDVNNVWCMGIKDNEEDATVLGMSFFIDKNIIFDHQKQAIGIAEMECPQNERPEIPNMFSNKIRRQRASESVAEGSISRSTHHNQNVNNNNTTHNNHPHVTTRDITNTNAERSVYNWSQQVYSNISADFLNEYKNGEHRPAQLSVNNNDADKKYYNFFESDAARGIYLAFVAVLLTMLVVSILYFGIKAISRNMFKFRRYANENISEESVHLTP